MSEHDVSNIVSILGDHWNCRRFKQICCRKGLKFTERGYARWLLASQ